MLNPLGSSITIGKLLKTMIKSMMPPILKCSMIKSPGVTSNFIY